mgnify:CR=1 FL=1
MCDTSATFGSIETTYAQKRKFAFDSLAFNIQDPIFCELFPEITDEIKLTLDERYASLSATKSNDSNKHDNQSQSVMSTASSSWLRLQKKYRKFIL